MTFLIRTIDHTATGREIVRDRSIESDRLSIGRATTNDVVVADLAVEQHHVSVSTGDRGQLSIEAIGSRDFTLDGHRQTSVTLDPARGGALTLGLYTLTFGREPDGKTLVTVTQEEREFGNRDAVRGFDLASAMPRYRAAEWKVNCPRLWPSGRSEALPRRQRQSRYLLVQISNQCMRLC